MIKINVEKAKEIHKDIIRQVRNPLLEKKDIEFMRSLESGDLERMDQIKEEKQKLRDVTKIVDNVEINENNAIEATQQLKQVWDSSILGDNPL
jgi:acetolactate synthase small subunit